MNKGRKEMFDQVMGAFDQAVGKAAQAISRRKAGATDDAIHALLVAGVSLEDVELLISADGGTTVVRQRRGPPPEVGQHSGYYP